MMTAAEIERERTVLLMEDAVREFWRIQQLTGSYDAAMDAAVRFMERHFERCGGRQ